MERVEGDTAAVAASDLSPRSGVGWKDDWAYVSVSLDSKKSERLPLRIFPTKSKSLTGLSSEVTPDGPKTPHRLERRLFRSLSPPLNSDRQACENLVSPKSHRDSEGPASPALSPTLQLQLAVDDRGHRAQSSEVCETVWAGKASPTEGSSPRFSSLSSASSTSGPDDEASLGVGGDDTWSMDSLSLTALAPRAEKETPSNRMSFVTSLNEELSRMKACMTRAIDLGMKLQHYEALEVSRLLGEKERAETLVKKSEQLNGELGKQLCNLRDEVQNLRWEQELEVMAMNNEIQELEMERNTFVKAARDEKKKREKLQNEVDSILGVLLEKKMNLESEREMHETALLNEKRKLQAMRKARDAAVKALEDGNKKLQVERDAMLMAMSDLTSRLDFERDAKLRSMRRTSIDMATMMSGLVSGGRSKRV